VEKRKGKKFHLYFFQFSHETMDPDPYPDPESMSGSTTLVEMWIFLYDNPFSKPLMHSSSSKEAAEGYRIEPYLLPGASVSGPGQRLVRLDSRFSSTDSGPAAPEQT
jgi:hypothetical protein